MKAKARENLEAALRLLDRGLLNAAASRLYFAAFQSAIHALQARNRVPADAGSGIPAWSHAGVQERIATIRGSEEDRRTFESLRRLRELADYGARSVWRRELEFLLPDAQRLVRDLTS
ncbi:MAG: HEPN domain-containing protein [Planctomycetes bacterium]|nr:HEPN domain-containing protein [Planctomycetota bacterium]